MDREVKRSERGWKAHFCEARYCQFSRNTLLELGYIRIVISTVGALYRNGEYEFIDHAKKAYYETVAFLARFESPYWDADTSDPIDICRYIKDIEFDADYRANKMHEDVIEEISKRLKQSTSLSIDQAEKVEGKTFDEWKKLGFIVVKGEKAYGRNKEGEAIFSLKQVTPF